MGVRDRCLFGVRSTDKCVHPLNINTTHPPTLDVVLLRRRRQLVLPHIHPDHPLPRRPVLPPHQPRLPIPRQPPLGSRHPLRVEAIAVDHPFILHEAKHARLGVPRLRRGGHGPDLDEAEPEPKKALHGLGVLVEAGGDPHRVGKGEEAVPEGDVQDGRVRVGGAVFVLVGGGGRERREEGGVRCSY